MIIQTIVNYLVIIGVVGMMLVVLYRKIGLKKSKGKEVLVLDDNELKVVKWAVAFPESWDKVRAGVISENKRLIKNAAK